MQRTAAAMMMNAKPIAVNLAASSFDSSSTSVVVSVLAPPCSEVVWVEVEVEEVEEVEEDEEEVELEEDVVSSLEVVVGSVLPECI